MCSNFCIKSVLHQTSDECKLFAILHILYIVTNSILNNVNPSYAVACCAGFYHCTKNATGIRKYVQHQQFSEKGSILNKKISKFISQRHKRVQDTATLSTQQVLSISIFHQQVMMFFSVLSHQFLFFLIISCSYSWNNHWQLPSLTF